MQDQDDVIVRNAERQRITGVPRGTWGRLEQEDKAPKRVPLTDGGTIGWLKSELQAWVQERIAARSAAGAEGHKTEDDENKPADASEAPAPEAATT